MQINLNTQRLTLRSVIQNDWKALQALWIDYNRSEYCKYNAYNPVDDELVYSRVEGWNCVNHVMKNHHYLAVCYYDNLIGFLVFTLIGKVMKLVIVSIVIIMGMVTPVKRWNV